MSEVSDCYGAQRQSYFRYLFERQLYIRTNLQKIDYQQIKLVVGDVTNLVRSFSSTKFLKFHILFEHQRPDFLQMLSHLLKSRAKVNDEPDICKNFTYSFVE